MSNADLTGVPRQVELTELRTFCTAADTGSLGRAAIRLRVSQPALSKRLRALETLAGVPLLERSSRGVTLTTAGRRVYEEAHRLLEQAEAVQDVLAGLRRSSGPIRLAASHSSTEAIVADVLAGLGDDAQLSVELVTANSGVVRDLVGDGRADLGVAASRPGRSPHPGVREQLLVEDEVVCAVPLAHPWARRARVTMREFLAEPMVVRDPSSAARWTVDSVLRARRMLAAAPLVEASTPRAAMREAHDRTAPLLLSRHVLPALQFVTVAVEGLSFPRAYVLVLPAVGEPPAAIAALIERMRAAVAGWGTGAPSR